MNKCYIVHVDASDSYDPDGSFEDLNFEWYCSGFAVTTGVATSFNFSGVDIPSSIQVRLTVTDSSSPVLSDILIKTIILSDYKASLKAVYVAAGEKVWSTIDGGKTWFDTILY